MADDLVELIRRLHLEVSSIGSRMDDQAEAARTEVGELRSDVLSHFDQVYQRFDRLESEYLALAAAVRRLETYVSSSVRGTTVDEEIRELKKKVADLQHRLDQLESTS